MKYSKLLCLTAAVISGLTLIVAPPSLALQERDVEASEIAPDEPAQYPNVSAEQDLVETEAESVGPDSQLEDIQIEFDDDTLIIEQEGSQEQEVIDLPPTSSN